MSLLSKLLAVSIAIGLIALILYVVFGQVTVRKLRKNPKTRHALGLEVVSGLDILNVAQAVSVPTSFMKRLKNSPLALVFADAEIIKRHTNKLDRVLGVLFYCLFMLSGLSLALLALFDVLGFFD